MNICKSIVGLFLTGLLCACGGGDGVDKTGRTDAPTVHGVVTSIAGTGAGGFLDGKVSKFQSPTAVTVGNDDVVYIADTGNHRIRKIVNGIVSTLAGTGTQGFADGPGATALFSSPRGIAVDANGNVYVADSGNHRVRKISSTGEVTTLAGNSAVGSLDSTDPTSATFDDPRGIAVDATGSTVYVSDSNQHVIRTVTSSGVATIAGSAGTSGSVDGQGSGARFTKPWGLALSSSGYLYIADCGDFWGSNHLIRKLDVSSGYVSTLAGTAGVPGKLDGAAGTTFNGPSGVAVDSKGVVYVADTGNSLIRKIDATGEVSTLAGTGSIGDKDATGTDASFSSPRGMGVDSHGDIYVADTENHLIRKIKK